MIVNWKKENAGAVVIPVVKDGVVIDKHTLVPGHNEVPDKRWELMKESCARHLKAGYIELITVKKKIKNKETKTVVKESKIDLAQLDDPNYLPYNEVMAAVKELDLYESFVEERKAKTGNAGSLSKEFLKKKFKEDPEVRAQVYDKIREMNSGTEEQTVETEAEIEAEIEVAVSLKDVPADKAVEIISTTFNPVTLESWLKVEARDEVRAAIANQIDELNKPPTKQKKGIFGRK